MVNMVATDLLVANQTKVAGVPVPVVLLVLLRSVSLVIPDRLGYGYCSWKLRAL